MSAIINKAAGLLNSTIAKTTELTNATVYWGKVGAEIGKTVYKAEGLAPPSQAQFKQVYENLLKFAKSPSEQKAFLQKATAFQPTKENLSKAAVYGIHGLAFFSVGEIIGRRKLFGYPALGHGHH